MKKIREIAKVGLGLLVVVVGMMGSVRTVSAGFGVSPSNIYHEYLKPGGHFEQKITLSRSDPDEDLEVIVEPVLEEMRDWFKFEPGMKFTFPKGQQRIALTAIIDVPEDAPYKTYQGIIRVKAMTSEGVSGGVAVVKGARVDVELVTTKVNVTEMEIKQMKMKDVVGGETLKMEVEATNKGNTEVAPTARVKLMNLQMQTLEELEDDDIGVLKPNETKIMVAEFETKLGQGEYFAEATVLGAGVVARKERLVFRISDRLSVEQVVIESSKRNGLAKMMADKQYLTRVGIELAIAGLIVMLVWYGKRMYLLAQAFFKARRYLALKILIGLLALLSIWVESRQVVGLKKNMDVREEKQEVVKTPDQTPSPGVDVTTGDGWVEGAATDGDSQVRVSGETNTAYPVYLEPSPSSRIVYYAREGDDFSVLEERADWYRVVLPDTTTGWLAKTSVKSAKSSQD